jgi:tetratricopeptide (TPR) repeat protein
LSVIRLSALFWMGDFVADSKGGVPRGVSLDSTQNHLLAGKSVYNNADIDDAVERRQFSGGTPHLRGDTMIGRRTAAFLVSSLLPLLAAGQTTPPDQRGVIPLRPLPGLLKGKTYALLIGISRYEHDPPVHSLQFADKDAETFKELLTTPVGGGLDPVSQIRLLTNERATQAAIDDAVNNFAIPHASPDNTLILFVAGHGVYLKTEVDPDTHRTIDTQPFILTHESNTQDPNTTGYPMGDFQGMIAEQARHYGRVLVFVDVCHAENVESIRGSNPELFEKVFQSRYGDLGLMMATHAKESALESSNFGGGHGAFSYFLISGLNGAAAQPDADSVSFKQLSHWVSNQVYGSTADYQEPSGKAPNEEMIVVPNVHLPGIHLEPAKPLSRDDVRGLRGRHAVAAERTPSRPQEPQTADAWERALERGSLLPEEPDSAFRLLAQMRRDPNYPAPELLAREQRLHVALADRGQQIMSRYIDGEQEALKKPDFDRCARYFDEAFGLDPSANFDRSRALFCHGRALIFDGQYDAAEGLLKQSIGIDPARAYAYNALGIAELERSARKNGQGLQEAADYFRKAMRFAPYWAYPIHNLALLESELGRYDDAIHLYELAMSVAPRFSYLPYNLGLLYERLGDLPNAQRWFERARVLAEQFRPHFTGPWPERARIWNALGTVARSQRHTARAADLFRKALADDPEEANARHNLALILAGQGDVSGADKLWLANLALAPKFIPSWIAYAESLAARGSAPQAIDTYLQIIGDLPGYVGAREVLARLYLAQHQAPEALAQLDAALQRTSSDAALFELRGDAESALGREDAAKADWNRAATLAPDRAARSRIRQKLSGLK